MAQKTKKMETYNDLMEGINALKEQGYSEDFNIMGNWLECQNGTYRIEPDEFQIDKFFRIEGCDSSPEESSILYAISSEAYGIKGTMVNAYGMYSDGVSDAILSKLKFS